MTLQGFFILFFFIPIKAPINTKGDEQQIHKTNMVSIVLNGTAAEDPSYHKNKSMMKNIEKAKLGYNTEVNKALISHLSDPNILKNLLEK